MAIRCTIALLLVLALPASGSGERLLDTYPPRAYVSIEGPISVRGRAPLSITNLPAGEYTVVAGGDGLAQGRSRLLLSDQGVSADGGAGVTSLLYPPGWRQLRDERWRGLTFLGASVVSGVRGAQAHADVRDADDDLDRAMRAYRRAATESAILDAREAVTEAASSKEDHEEVRRLWGIYLGATWAAAALEGGVFSPRARLISRDGGEYQLAIPRADRTRLVSMSLLVPGSGQRYAGRYERGTLFTFAVAFLAAQAIESHDDFLAARRRQSAAQTRYDRAASPQEVSTALAELERTADDVDDEQLKRGVFVGAAIAVHALNVIDAFIIGGRSGRERVSGPALSVAPAGDGIGARIDWSFR